MSSRRGKVHPELCGTDWCRCYRKPLPETNRASSATPNAGRVRTLPNWWNNCEIKSARRFIRREKRERLKRRFISPSSCSIRRERSRVTAKMQHRADGNSDNFRIRYLDANIFFMSALLEKIIDKTVYCKSAIAHIRSSHLVFVWSQNFRRRLFCFQISNFITGNLG